MRCEFDSVMQYSDFFKIPTATVRLKQGLEVSPPHMVASSHFPPSDLFLDIEEGTHKPRILLDDMAK